MQKKKVYSCIQILTSCVLKGQPTVETQVACLVLKDGTRARDSSSSNVENLQKTWSLLVDDVHRR